MNKRRCCFLEILASSSVSVVSDIWRGAEIEVYLVERLRLGANAEAVVTAERRRAADVNFMLIVEGGYDGTVRFVDARDLSWVTSLTNVF